MLTDGASAATRTETRLTALHLRTGRPRQLGPINSCPAGGVGPRLTVADRFEGKLLEPRIAWGSPQAARKVTVFAHGVLAGHHFVLRDKPVVMNYWTVAHWRERAKRRAEQGGTLNEERSA